MSKPREAWYPYMKNITRRYPRNKHPEENEAVADALEAADPETRELIEAVYISSAITMRGAAGNLYLSYSTAARKTSLFFAAVAKNLGLPVK